jgi:hypothetical protein
MSANDVLVTCHIHRMLDFLHLLVVDKRCLDASVGLATSKGGQGQRKL